jgi:hypothetical protein
VDDLLINEARFIRVVRAGKVVKKVKPKKGFKILRKGMAVKMKRMSFQEKRTRRMAMRAVWRKGKASRVIKSKRKLKISLRKRRVIFGGSTPRKW